MRAARTVFRSVQGSLTSINIDSMHVVGYASSATMSSLLHPVLADGHFLMWDVHRARSCAAYIQICKADE